MSFRIPRSEESAKFSAGSTAPPMPKSSNPPFASANPNLATKSKVRDLRSIDAFNRLLGPLSPPTNSPTSSLEASAPRSFTGFGSVMVPAASTPIPPTQPPNTRRAVDMFAHFGLLPDPAAPVVPAAEPGTSPLSSTPSASIQTRRIARLPKRAVEAQPQPDIDLTMDDIESPNIDLSAPRSTEVIDISDSSDEEFTSVRPHATRRPSNFIYNTHDNVATRQTLRGWKGPYGLKDWVLSRDEYHSEQVDRDRTLAEEMDEFPTYARFSSTLNLVISIFYSVQAISSSDMQSLHSYLMARYGAETFDDYVRVLTLFRNTRAIELVNARHRHSQLHAISESLSVAQYAVLRRLQERRSSETPSSDPPLTDPPLHRSSTLSS